MSKYQVRLESPKSESEGLVAAILPGLRAYFEEDLTYKLRRFPSRYSEQILTYIDIYTEEDDSA